MVMYGIFALDEPRLSLTAEVNVFTPDNTSPISLSERTRNSREDDILNSMKLKADLSREDTIHKSARIVSPQCGLSERTPERVDSPGSLSSEVSNQHINLDATASQWRSQKDCGVLDRFEDPINKTNSRPLHTDFSADAILGKNACNASNLVAWNNQQSSSAIPTSAFLQQLYASRESVIRSSTTNRGGGYTTDLHNTLPTPPISEGYNESYPISVYNNVSGMTGYSDYHNAITPPSSVSPREKTGNLSDTYENLRHQCNNNTELNLPVKPYALHSSMTVDPLTNHQYNQSAVSMHLYHSVSSHPS